MSIIGLTGPTGAGKSTVRQVAEKLGFFTVDCDEVAKSVTDEPKVLSALCVCFGKDILKDGALDRKLLASRAFSSPEQTELLNKTVLPFVIEKIEKIIAGKKNVLLDAPTLFESGADALCDTTIGVLADKKLLKERITARDNLSLADAEIRLSAAKPDSFFKEKCAHIIENNGGFSELKIKAEEILPKYITEE